MAQVLENNVMGVLSGAVDAVTKTLPLVTLAGWPVLAGGDHCLATLIGLNQNGVEAAWEIVKVTGRVGSSLTVDRGQEGIAARAWPAGTVLQMRLTAGSVATPSLVEAVRLALLQMMADDRAQVDGLLGAKVDKNGAKVLSDNNYTNDERVKLANIQAAATKNLADAVLLERSNHTGGFNGLGKYNSMLQDSPLPFSSPPSAFIGMGTIFGIVRGSEIGLVLTDYGVGRVDAQWSDLSPPLAFIRTVWLGDREYVSHAVNASKWSPWVETTSIAGTTGLADALDAAMRVRLLSEPTILGFLDQMWHLGPGYYRNDSVNPDTQLYGAGFFSKTADTWSFMSVDRTTGTPMFLSGIYADIAAGSQKKFLLGSAAKRNAQTNGRDNSDGALMITGAFGLGGTSIYNDTNLATITPFPLGVSHGYLNRAINAPFTDFYGYITVEKVDTLYAVITVKSVGEGYAYKRTYSNGVAGPWLKIIDSVTAVGAISSGGIIERGANSNGEYVKFADGTLICAVTRSPIFANVSNLLYDWTFPSAYIAAPNVTPNVVGGTLQVAKNFMASAYSIAPTGASVSCLSVGAFVAGDESKVTLQATAIGRWK